MTLLINADEVTQVLTMPRCIDAMHQAMVDEARGSAVNHPRQRYRAPRTPAPGEVAYQANMIAGAVPSLGVAALRYDSMLNREVEQNGKRRKEYVYPSRRSWGFVILFSLETGEPLAIYQDFSVSPLRVGATTGVAVRALARKDARRVGLFGSGNEARRNLEAISLVRDLESVRVFSPNTQHRAEFAEEMTGKLGVTVQPVASPTEVVDGADIIMCATNSSEPLFPGELLQPGQTVVTIVNSDHSFRRSEVDATTMKRSEVIAVSSKESLVSNGQQELLGLIESGELSWDRVTEIGQVLIGEHPGRTGDEQITYYKNNAGMGIQFAAAGAYIYRACKDQGLGREVPTEWFGADVGWWLDRGFNPSP